MFLKRLELQGFKSFAGKTILEFPARITCIVGPNGSGKSNVIDAFRWVLGERGVKHLRGESLGNLIFAGTPKRSASGLARASLIFDNRKRLFPLDAEEVELTRKIDRSGTSEYLLNDAECRLRDVVEYLAKAKIGTRGLTIIGQGESDVFVKSSPEDRRFMIEEILGLREFRIKKREAERRLENARTNMDKVRALIKEIGPHLRFLQRERKRWERRGELESRLREAENAYFSLHYRRLTERLREVRETVRDYEAKKQEKEKEVALFEKKLESFSGSRDDENRARAARKRVSELMDKRSELEREIVRREARREIEAEKQKAEKLSAEHLLRTLRAAYEEIQEICALDNAARMRERLLVLKKKIGEFFEDGKPVADRDAHEIAELKRAEAELEREIAEARKEEEVLGEREREANREFRNAVRELEEKKRELEAARAAMQSYFLEEEKINLRLRELQNQWEAAGRKVDELALLSPPDSGARLEDLEKTVFRLRSEISSLGDIDMETLKEAEESEKRHEFLVRELKDLETAASHLQKLIRSLEEKIHTEFKRSFQRVNEQFNEYVRIMFRGGRARMTLERKRKAEELFGGSGEAPSEESGNGGEPDAGTMGDGVNDAALGVEINVSLPRKKIIGLDMLSGGEKSLVSLAALFALISVSPPPFLVLDEIDAALDDENARRFAELVTEFSNKSQFVIVTHNRVTMESAGTLYGITMGDDGVSKVFSLKLEDADLEIESRK